MPRIYPQDKTVKYETKLMVFFVTGLINVAFLASAGEKSIQAKQDEIDSTFA